MLHMQNQKPLLIICGAALLAGALWAAKTGAYTPGSKTLVLSHNAYPDHGKYTDRLDRAIAAGLPFATEQDLAWVDGKSLMIHGAKNVAAADPTLDSYFIPRVKPLIEKALQEGNKGNWPLVILYLDIKNDPPEHLEAISKWLDKYDSWLTTAVKTADIAKQSPLDLKPMMVLVEDKQNDIKQQFFYDQIPVGAKIRVFGSVTKFDENPQRSCPRTKRLKPSSFFPRSIPSNWFRIRLTTITAGLARTGHSLKRAARPAPASGQRLRKRVSRNLWTTAIVLDISLPFTASMVIPKPRIKAGTKTTTSAPKRK